MGEVTLNSMKLSGSDWGHRGRARERDCTGEGCGEDMARQRQGTDNTDGGRLDGAVQDE